MSEWTSTPFGDLTDNLDSRRIPVKEWERQPGPYPYYGASGVVDYVKDYIFEGDYLLIAEDGENLRTRATPIAFMARGRFWVNNHAHIVKGNQRADTRFLMYALQYTDVSGFLTGSTMPKLTQQNLNRIPILAPLPQEQRAISRVLGLLDDKISLNHQTNDTVESLVRAIFLHFFPYGPDDELPSGWHLGNIESVAHLSRGVVNPSETPEEIFDHYSIPAFDQKRMPVTEPGSGIHSNKWIVPRGVVLLSKLNPRLPRVWFPRLNPVRRSICSTEFFPLLPRIGFSPEFIYCLCTSHAFTEEFAIMTTGTSGSHQRVRPDFATAIDVAIPPPDIITRFSNTVRPLLDRIKSNREEALVLAALRDTLSPKLLSGEIRVPQAQQALNEAV